VCASLATAVLETLPWVAPPAPSVRPVQSAATARVAQQIPAHLVAVAEPLLLLDPQVLLPVCVHLGEFHLSDSVITDEVRFMLQSLRVHRR